MEPRPIETPLDVDAELDLLLSAHDARHDALRAAFERRDGEAVERIDAQILAGLVSP